MSPPQKVCGNVKVSTSGTTRATDAWRMARYPVKLQEERIFTEFNNWRAARYPVKLQKEHIACKAEGEERMGDEIFQINLKELFIQLFSKKREKNCLSFTRDFIIRNM